MRGARLVLVLVLLGVMGCSGGEEDPTPDATGKEQATSRPTTGPGAVPASHDEAARLPAAPAVPSPSPSPSPSPVPEAPTATTARSEAPATAEASDRAGAEEEIGFGALERTGAKAPGSKTSSPAASSTGVASVTAAPLEDGEKVKGFLGLYHPDPNGVYASDGIAEDTPLYEAFRFGFNGICSRPSYCDYPFEKNILDHCVTYDTNRVLGICGPPTEGGAVANPANTEPLAPAGTPGMIQTAHRFSVLSRTYAQVSGMVIDDFYQNWSGWGGAITPEALRDIKDALLGKSLSDQGEVLHDTPATSPHMKLYIVVYRDGVGAPAPAVLSQIDGVSFWMYRQHTDYGAYASCIASLKANYRENGVPKDIIPGIYIHNEFGDQGVAGIDPIISQSLDLYDQGYSSGVFLFAGCWLVKKHISRERWSSLDLPGKLSKLYYPHLGTAMGVVYDENNRWVKDALVTVTRCDPATGLTVDVARKRTDANGRYRFGAWAGRETAGRRVYTITIEKPGFVTQTLEGTIVARGSVQLRAVTLKKG